MSTPWQNTLFYWYGKVEYVHSSSLFQWSGKIVPLPDCEDARRGATPSRSAFYCSKSEFSVKSDRIENGNLLKGKESFELSLSSTDSHQHLGDGFDNAGEGGNTKVEKPMKIKDKKHNLLFAHGQKLDFREWRMVFGNGENVYGDFIEAGIYRRGAMLLARRYLAHPRDGRLGWTLQELQSQVMFQLPPLILDPTAWSRIQDYWMAQDNHLRVDERLRHSPWRTPALCGQKWRQRALREESTGKLRKYSVTAVPSDLCEPTSSNLLMPLPRPFRLRLFGDFRPYPGSISWEDQCWGCGGPGIKPRFSETIFEWTDEGPERDIAIGQYCSSLCVRQAIPEIARCSSAWLAAQASSGRFLKKSAGDEPFWDCLGAHEERLLRSAGWHTDYGDWILEPPEISERSYEEDYYGDY